MGRVINTNGPGKRRSHLMRTIAEILRHLSQKNGVDDEVRDMAATLVFSLRIIDETIIESISAWEKRGYWKKADKFQMEWLWTAQVAKKIEGLIEEDDWAALPEVMIRILPHVADIKISKMMRKESEWEGSYDRLITENSE